MGASTSAIQDSPPNGGIMDEYEDYPLLSSITNPVNRFSEDFASSLVNEDNEQNADELSIALPALIKELDGFTILKSLASGSEADVYVAEDNQTHTLCAIKRYINIQIMDDNGPREMLIAQELDHPNCLKIYQCFKSSSGNYIVIMPYSSDGSLSVSNTPQITVNGAISLLLQIGSALQYMHSLNLIHRDVKPENILIFPNSYVLCDFSISVKLNHPDEKLNSKIGTSYFMAPEVSYNNEYSPKPADMWALGISVYWLLYGTLPFHLLENLDVDNTVNKTAFNHQLTFPSIPVVPIELKTIISRLLDKNFETRLTADQLIQDSYLQTKYYSFQQAANFLRTGLHV